MITQPLQEVQPTEAVEEQVQYWDVPAVVSQNTTATSEVPTEFFELCPEGDVILVATGTREKRPEEESLTGTLLEEELDTELYRAKIRVSSVTLSLASKVFRALFSPRYSEGQAIREASSEDKEIALEDDDPYALTTLCRVLHYAAKLDIAEKLCDNINYFYKVAILADKYDCCISAILYRNNIDQSCRAQGRRCYWQTCRVQVRKSLLQVRHRRMEVQRDSCGIPFG